MQTPKRTAAFVLWGIAAVGIWRSGLRWLHPQAPVAPAGERRTGHERRTAERREHDRRRDVNGVAAWIGAATERRSGGERRHGANRRGAERRQTAAA